jgi:uncharacterized iron-regulated membrane protein
MDDVLATALSGLAVVLGSMLLITGCCLLLRRFAQRARPAPPEPAQDDPVLIAVLAAAAAEALGSPVVIHRVRLAPRPDAERWSRAGRMDIMSSHRVGPRR